MKHQFDIEDKKELIKSELLRIAHRLGKTPTQKEYKQQIDTTIKIDQINYLFGSWNNAIAFAGLDLNSNTPPRNNISLDDLKDEFISVANKLKTMPSKTVFRTHAKYSWTPYTRKFGTWQKTIDYFKEHHPNSFDFELYNSKRDDKKVQASKLLNLDLPLVNTPSNEFETIVLFALLARELGIKILKVNAAFPDGLIIKDGEEIKVEFEYLSSNYLQHAHPVLPDIICICWRKDIEIAGVEIIALEEYLRNKKK